MKSLIAVVTAVVVLTGCGATSGTKVTDQQLAQMQVGKTSYGDAVSVLGQPNGETVLPGGKRILVWAYSEVTTRPETFIPIAGAFVGGADAKSKTVTLTFDADGRLSSTGTNNTNANSSLTGGTTSN
jgi:outer membrane protein assembly factor BamE (lipoprotein component of BamABCDE complex)